MKKWIAGLLCLLFIFAGVTAKAANGADYYDDVAPDAWYAACVADVTERGLMNGTGSGCFTPEGTLTRAMLVTVLWRMNGCPAPAETGVFTDVKAGSWYADAVDWAAENSVVEGIGGSLFDPASPITREQMAAVFYRWANGAGLDTATEETEAAQRESASDWAVDAVNWAISRHLLTKILLGGLPHGGSGYFYNVPSYAKRGEIAVFLSRFCLEYLDGEGERTNVTVEAAGLKAGSCDLLLTSPDGKRLAVYVLADAHIGTHFYAEPVDAAAEKTEGRSLYGDLPRSYDEQGRLLRIERDGIPVYSVVYDDLGRVTELCCEEIICYHVVYAPWGDPLFLEIKNSLTGDGTVFAFYCEEDSGVSLLTAWGEDGKSLSTWPSP